MINDFVAQFGQESKEQDLTQVLTKLSQLSTSLRGEIDKLVRLAERFERYYKDYVGDLQGRLRTQIS